MEPGEPRDTKDRVRLPDQLCWLYPDLSVTRRPNPLQDSFQDAPSLVACVMFAQRARWAIVLRRMPAGFVRVRCWF